MNDEGYYAALSHSPTLLAKLLQGMARAAFLGSGIHQAKSAFAAALARTMALADALGRKRIIDGAVKAGGPISAAPRAEAEAFHAGYDSMIMARFASGYGDLPHPDSESFEEAFSNLAAREPMIARNREEIEKAYGVGAGFAVSGLSSKLTEEAWRNVTEKLWAKTIELGVSGRTANDARKVLPEVADISHHYAETIYRTNLAGAYTAGRFKQLEDPDIRAVVPAFEYSAVMDVNTRKNHAAGDGLIADASDPIWDKHSPPQGFNCRCDMRLVDRFELEERGLLLPNGHAKRWTPPSFGAAHPDPGFTVTRPDRRAYG